MGSLQSLGRRIEVNLGRKWQPSVRRTAITSTSSAMLRWLKTYLWLTPPLGVKIYQVRLWHLQNVRLGVAVVFVPLQHQQIRFLIWSQLLEIQIYTLRLFIKGFHLFIQSCSDFLSPPTTLPFPVPSLFASASRVPAGGLICSRSSYVEDSQLVLSCNQSRFIICDGMTTGREFPSGFITGIFPPLDLALRLITLFRSRARPTGKRRTIPW